MYEPSVQSCRSTQRKRDPTHTAFSSPSKRRKTDHNQVLNSSAVPPSPSAFGHSGRRMYKQWNDNPNKNASRCSQISENDPSPYINRQSSSDGNSLCAVPSNGSSRGQSLIGKPTAPTRSLLARMESSDSNSEDFRSVIDDLTIQNKKLKKKLRQYEKLHCSHLEQEKLFEVRMHGLAGHRKRELERTLRSFASSIDDYSPNKPTFNSVPSRQPRAAVAASEPSSSLQTTANGIFHRPESIAAMRKPSSASTSYSKPLDSAYASMSGQTGITQLQPIDTRKSDAVTHAPQKQRNVQSNVQSYLHDIPETLVPRHTLAMSERSKSKLVVQRLEQIFTGKGAALRTHGQSHQQQEVSHSAAQADQARGRSLTKEGVREARILPSDADLQVDTLSEVNAATQQSRQSSHDRPGAQVSRDQSPDQRPTRPLDLDIHRAQVPEDNIDYIRHLGLSLPAASTKSDPTDGWVYLNLLISMAQLHTLNVTPEFIRNAIANVSSQFQLSDDGSKVKWLGGSQGTNLTSDDDDSSEIGKSISAGINTMAAKRGSVNKTSSSGVWQGAQEPNTALPNMSQKSSSDHDFAAKRRPVFLTQETGGSDFHYKPLFFHAASSDGDDDSEIMSSSIPSSDVMENATALNSGINSGSHGLRETEVNMRKQNAENGPIIFYHKARFCTDLSGDASGSHFAEIDYHRYTQDPVGCSADDLDKSVEEQSEEAPEAMELDFVNVEGDGSTLDLEDLRSCLSDCFSSTSSTNVSPVPMEASGLGGVQPEDNFVLKVQVRHQDRKTQSLSHTSRQRHHHLSKVTPTRLRIPRSQPITTSIKSEVVSTSKTDLRPSSLPPPSYAYLPYSSSDSEDEDDHSEVSVTAENDLHHSCARPTENFNGALSNETKDSSSKSATSNCDDNDDDDDSIDLLAHARVLDPIAIAARERDFDNDAVPSGSVAATAGQSSSGLIRPIAIASSDVDSMSVGGDDRSSIDISV
ncbi:hypothetical protein ACLMJK_000140 [Lecanora helva]